VRRARPISAAMSRMDAPASYLATMSRISAAVSTPLGMLLLSAQPIEAARHLQVHQLVDVDGLTRTNLDRHGAAPGSSAEYRIGMDHVADADFDEFDGLVLSARPRP